MVHPAEFLAALDGADIRFATGVPDSLLKDVCACISTHFSAERHVIAPNEGTAVGIATGQYLATGRPALVYMQNSGLGNAMNPLVSLADHQVVGIPMLLLIGWRGEVADDGTQIRDEPQHTKQGQITTSHLDLLNVPYRVLDERSVNICTIVQEMASLSLARSAPVALLVRKGTFAHYDYVAAAQSHLLPTREDAIKKILRLLPDDMPVVSTTGMASRELFEFRATTSNSHRRDFLTVGGMGHASQIASGIAMAQPNRKVVCIDGDGATLMHMGGLTISGQQKNLIHIVINNGAHDSVGGQPTVAERIDLAPIATGCGYGFVAQATTTALLAASLSAGFTKDCSVFIEVKCQTGARLDLGRPDRSPTQNKDDFMSFLAEYANER